MSKSKVVPFEFLVEALDRLQPTIRPMFGCHAIYVGDKIVLMLRKKETATRDNGVWVAIAPGHLDTLKKEFPSLRPVEVLGEKTTAWQNLPDDALDFEESVNKICELVLRNDLRVGKIPKSKAKKKASAKKKTSKNK
jgi:hypothetical protein